MENPHDMFKKHDILRFEDGQLFQTVDTYVTEFPLTIMLNGVEFATIICSPDHLEALVLGFIASEGVIHKHDDLQAIEIDDSKGFAHVTLNHAYEQRIAQSTQRVVSSCCGKSREFYFKNDAAIAKTSLAKVTLTPQHILNMMTRLQSASEIFKKTGGLHNAAISDGETFFEHRQDIGRHNALDKLYGFCIANHIPVRDKVLIFSGRISSEILIKAAKIGVGIILSKSAPSTLAVQLAKDLNITTVGFIRNGTFNVYSHPERIIQP